jgi:hypothetical protein
MVKEINTSDRALPVHQYDPKNKTEDKKEKLLNRQDDNSYDEAEETKAPGQKDQVKQADTNKDFEYSDNGEFQNDSIVQGTNPKDEYL